MLHPPKILEDGENLQPPPRGGYDLAVQGDRIFPEKAGVEVKRIDEALMTHIWQRRKEQLATENRSDTNKAASSRGCVVNHLTTTTCKPRVRPLPNHPSGSTLLYFPLSNSILNT